MGWRASAVLPLPPQSRAKPRYAGDGASVESPGPIYYAQLQHELHRQATQRKPASTSSSSSSSSNSPALSQYSISKLQAFDDFHKATSLVQGIGVLLATPIPCMVVMLALESIPLVHPSLGWKANYMFFVRMFFGMVVIAASIAIECKEFIPETQFTWKHLSGIAVCQAIAFVGTLVGISVAAGVFPVPYSMLIALVPTMGVGVGVHYLLVRLRIPFIPDFASRYRHLFGMTVVGVLPVVVYPVYAAIFMQLSSRYQVWFSLLLPVVKFALRFLLMRKMKAHMDVAGTMSASGHLFHVLFTVTCLQNAKTFATVGFILAWNVANAVRCCLKMVYYARRNRELRQAARSRHDVSALPPLHSQRETTSENVAKRALALVEQPKVLATLVRQDPSVLVSSFHRYSSPKWITKHQELLAQQRQRSASCRVRASTPSPSLAQRSASERARRVSSAIRSFLSSNPAQALLSHRTNIVPRMSFSGASPVEVHDTLAILHANEICLLHSYVGGMVYLVYGLYLRVVFSLPNRDFIFAMVRVTTEQEVQNTLRIVYILYAVEIAIMIAYFIVIRWTLSVPSIRQLAFVLYSQRWIIQAKMVMVTVTIFAFPIMHTGDDITFEFAWLKATSNMTTGGDH